MIVTLTGNLLAEHTFDFPSWKAGATQRAHTQSFQVGGKGINVAKMLNRLKVPSKALCFAGGEAGKTCAQWLNDNNIPHQIISSTTPTRMGLVVRTPDHKETTFLGQDQIPDAKAFASCARFIQKLPKNTPLALCGSFPGWSSKAAVPLKKILAQHACDNILAVDSYGPPLAQLCKSPLTLVKINRTEFDGLFPPTGPHDTMARRLIHVNGKYPVKAWVITDGAKPIWFIEKGSLPGSIPSLKTTQVSPTGSGDVLFACILNSLFNRKNTLATAIRSAIPFASANAAHPGVADFDLKLISNTLNHPKS